MEQDQRIPYLNDVKKSRLYLKWCQATERLLAIRKFLIRTQEAIFLNLNRLQIRGAHHHCQSRDGKGRLAEDCFLPWPVQLRAPLWVSLMLERPMYSFEFHLLVFLDM